MANDDVAKRKAAAAAAWKQKEQAAADSAKAAAELEETVSLERKLEAAETLGAFEVDWSAVDAPGGCIIVRRPPAAIMRKFIDSPKVSFNGAYELCSAVVVAPSMDEFDAIADKFSGIVGMVASRAIELGNAERRLIAGK